MLEQELKLTAPSIDVLNRVTNYKHVQEIVTGSVSPAKRFLANYYDTVDKKFEKNLCSLRVRLEGDCYRAAFKLAGEIVDGLSSRPEYECDIDGLIHCVGNLPDGLLKSKTLEFVSENEKLMTMVVVDMQRQILNLEVDGTKIEFVADHGNISANSRQAELFEIELELKSGNLEEVIKLGQVLKDEFNLIPSILTKHQIGLALWE